MNKDIILIVAAILMAPMVGAAVTDAEYKEALTSGQMRKDCLREAVCLWSEMEKLIESAERAKAGN